MLNLLFKKIRVSFGVYNSLELYCGWTFCALQQAMSKKVIEDLLRKGAYGAIMEEENDEGSK